LKNFSNKSTCIFVVLSYPNCNPEMKHKNCLFEVFSESFSNKSFLEPTLSPFGILELNGIPARQ